MITKAWNHNSHGGGMAWREPAEDGEGVEVVWKKSLNLEQMLQMAADLPLPYVMHFRIASVGGKNPYLTHPFPIEESGRNPLEGRTKGQVLFHNGHWTDWKRMYLDGALRYAKKMPSGALSDTRAMAWLASFMGNGLVDFIEEKGVAFGPDNVETFWGAGWSIVEDIWVSNESFLKSGGHNWTRTGGVDTGAYNRPAGGYNSGNFTICQERSCHIRHNLDADGYCHLHSGKTTKTPMGNVGNANQPTHSTPSSAAQTPTKAESVGGTQPQPTPFQKFLAAKRDFEDNKLSNRKFKAARAAYEKALRQMGREVPPIVVRGRTVIVERIH